MTARIVALRPFSRPWWAAWHRDVAAGRPTAFLVSQAKRGRARVVAITDMPTATEGALLVAVPVNGPDFTAWSIWFQRRYGVPLPRPSAAPVVWMRAARPASEAA